MKKIYIDQRMTLEQFKALSERKGFKWFNPETMSYWGTKVEHWESNTGFFVTSERNPSNQKRYSIRLANFETGTVSNVSRFFEFETLSDAMDALLEEKIA